MTAAYIATRDVPLDELTPFPGNAKRGDVEAIRASLRRNGQYRSLVVREIPNGPLIVLAGNHTMQALAAEGREQARCEVVQCDDATARRINLADNRTAELGSYDDEALTQLLDALDGDYDGTGWAEEDLADLIGEVEELPPVLGDPDDVPDAPTMPQSVHGDLLLLGPHRLLCGDAANPDDLKRVTDGLGDVGIVYTDPPYGIAIVSEAGKVGAAIGYPFGGVKNGKQGSAGTVKTTAYIPVAGDETTDAARDAFALLTAEYPSARHVWWGGNHYAASAGLPDSSCWLIWDKETNGNFADAELAWTNHPGAVRLFRHMWNGMLRASEHGKRVHPTQKPCALAEWAFGVIDPKGERKVVLDVFGGSGSTLMAAHSTGRAAAVIEMEPAYIDVIARRWEAETGQMPQRVSPDGRTEPVSFILPH